MTITTAMLLVILGLLSLVLMTGFALTYLGAEDQCKPR